MKRYRTLRGILGGLLLGLGVAGLVGRERLWGAAGTSVVQTIADDGTIIVQGLTSGDASAAALNTSRIQECLTLAAKRAGGRVVVRGTGDGLVYIGAGTGAVQVDNCSALVISSDTTLEITAPTTLKLADSANVIMLTNYHLNGGGDASGTTDVWDSNITICGGGTIDFNMTGKPFNLNSQQRNMNFARVNNLAIHDLTLLNGASGNGDGAACLLGNDIHGLTLERLGVVDGTGLAQCENNIQHVRVRDCYRDASNLAHADDFLAFGIQVKGGFGSNLYDYSDVSGPLSNRLDYQPGSVVDVVVENCEIRDNSRGSLVVFHRGAPFTGSTMTAAKACYATDLVVRNVRAKSTSQSGNGVVIYDDYNGTDSIWIGTLLIDGVEAVCPLTFSASANTIVARNINGMSDGTHNVLSVTNVLSNAGNDSRSGTVTISSLDVEYKQRTPFTGDVGYPFILDTKTYVKNLRLLRPELNVTANLPLLYVRNAKLDYASIVDPYLTADANSKGTVISVGTGSTGALTFSISGGHLDTWNKFIEAYETATLSVSGEIVANRLSYFGYAASGKTLTMVGAGSIVRSGTESSNFFIEGKLRLDMPRLHVGSDAGYLNPSGTGAPQTGDQFFADGTGWSGGGSVTSAGPVIYVGGWKMGAR